MKPQPVPVKPVEQPKLDMDEIGKTFFDDPAGSAEKVAKHLYDKKMGDLQRELITVQLNVSKNAALQDPNCSWAFEQYPNEVEQVVQNTPNDAKLKIPDIYKRAAEMITAKHIEEFKTKAVNDYVAEQKKTTSTAVPFTETSSVAPPSQKTNRVVITPKIQEEMNQAARLGMDPREYLRRKYGKE